MKVVVNGGSGFLGQRLAAALLQEHSLVKFDTLVLADVNQPKSPEGFENDGRVICLELDLTAPGAADQLVDADTTVLFHLAAIVSGHAEVDFDLGLRVNFDATRQLLEAARHKFPNLKLVFTSTCGVFGGDLPKVIDDWTAVQPETSYGIAKAMSELLINDYTRRGYVDGRIVRLPTVSVRAGVANKAITSFASGLVREPLNGEIAEIPVPLEQEIWLCSPATVIKNIIYAATVHSSSLGRWKGVNLPGVTVTVQDMLDALRKVAGDQVANLVKFTKDKTISEMVSTLPTRFDNTRALKLGFSVDNNYEDIIRAYIRDELKRN